MMLQHAVAGAASPTNAEAAMRALLLAAFAAGTTAFTCTTSDIVCDALGDLWAATNTGTGTWLHTAGWVDASAGTATDYCTFYGVTCDSNSALTSLYVRAAAAQSERANYDLFLAPRMQRLEQQRTCGHDSE